MEGIPSKARNLQMNLLMGKLYRFARHNRAAIACYKECLRLVSESNCAVRCKYVHGHLVFNSYLICINCFTDPAPLTIKLVTADITTSLTVVCSAYFLCGC